MTFLQARTTKVLLSAVLFFAARGFAGNITVLNASFEDTTGVTFTPFCGPGCQFSVNQPIPGWMTSDESLSGLFQPGTQLGTTAVFDSVPDGITTAYSNGGTISQTVLPAVQDGVTYILTVDLGFRKDLPFHASADLLVGGVPFMATGMTPVRGNWSTWTATFTGSAANVGDKITIQLNSSGAQGNFDNVQLTAVPEPASIGVVGFGLAGLLAFARRNRRA